MSTGAVPKQAVVQEAVTGICSFYSLLPTNYHTAKVILVVGKKWVSWALFHLDRRHTTPMLLLSPESKP
jgi:hypothetical protein